MKTIVWDVDDVLNDLMHMWFERTWLPEHPETTITYAEITENPPHRILGIDLATYLSSIDEFRKKKFPSLSPIPELTAWFETHGQKCHHMALTAVTLNAAHASAAWVLTHFGRWIHSFNLVPSRRDHDATAPVYFPDKAEFIAWFGHSNLLFVDDSVANIAAVQKLGIPSFLISRPWNHNPETLAQTLERLTLSL